MNMGSIAECGLLDLAVHVNASGVEGTDAALAIWDLEVERTGCKIRPP
jgi:hypothetical protein